jgi:hypothetical protein
VRLVYVQDEEPEAPADRRRYARSRPHTPPLLHELRVGRCPRVSGHVYSVLAVVLTDGQPARASLQGVEAVARETRAAPSSRIGGRPRPSSGSGPLRAYRASPCATPLPLAWLRTARLCASSALTVFRTNHCRRATLPRISTSGPSGSDRAITTHGHPPLPFPTTRFGVMRKAGRRWQPMLTCVNASGTFLM